MIRLAEPGDEAAIRLCARLAFSRYTAAIGRDPAPMAADVAAQIAAGQIHVALAPDGALQGYAAAILHPYHLYLDALAVMPDWMGHGIGRALMTHCEAAARHADLSRIELCTNTRMIDNQAIYPRLGFRETGRGIEDGYDRIFFSKTL